VCTENLILIDYVTESPIPMKAIEHFCNHLCTVSRRRLLHAHKALYRPCRQARGGHDGIRQE
jgi:hypothetical protein